MVIDKLKKNQTIRNTYYLYKSTKQFFSFKPFLLITQYIWFIKEFKVLKKQTRNDKFQTVVYYPCLFDNLKHTPIEPTYFFPSLSAKG